MVLGCSIVASVILLASILAAGSGGDWSTAILIEVDQSGNGDYRKIQDAIDSVPSNNSDHIFILVKPGVYEEKIVVPADKPFITLSGTKATETTGVTVERFLSLLHFQFWLLISWPVISQFWILSHQDTLLDDRGRHYYSNCYVEGDTDFIFGNGASIFQKCHLHSVAGGMGAITAQRRQRAEEETGFTFVKCKITGVKSAVLGRPWGKYSRVVFALSYMSNVVLPQGWDDWGDSSKQRSAYYGEYKCYGAGARTSKRVKWSHRLSGQEAAPYLRGDMMGGSSWIRSAPSHFRRISAAISPQPNS
ncbi:UNVERIFIED_CONTAM: putative pectinesterase 11 [Sesamum radiatum]|uniref:Pectinesterase n=1 Tax=Sesamum radiatum TaxID=300843 RepID=A0AAW2QEU4_SESRA